jgi:hypothetical protein
MIMRSIGIKMKAVATTPQEGLAAKVLKKLLREIMSFKEFLMKCTIAERKSPLKIRMIKMKYLLRVKNHKKTDKTNSRNNSRNLLNRKTAAAQALQTALQVKKNLTSKQS